MITRAFEPEHEVERVQPGSLEAAIIDEELMLLAKVQRQLAAHQLAQSAVNAEYDRELISLRDQIAEARTEDLPPLIAEMYRLQAVGANTDKGRALPVDVKSPYFGHLKLAHGKKTRDVLIGSRGFVTTGEGVAIVDWRNAPVSRIYYCYDEGDDYEESFGGRATSGEVLAKRTVGIVEGELRRISWSGGSVARRSDGTWISIPADRKPTLRGGAGIAARPPVAQQQTSKTDLRGKLGVVGDESLREDKHLKEITALIDPEQFKMITRPDSGIVILQGGAGSGKTTVALHRAAYLHFQDPQTFAPKKMAIIVKSAPLTEYISRVLPSLDVHGTLVVTLKDFMSRTRRKVMPDLVKEEVGDVPPSVARLKKHPGVLALLEAGVAEEAADILAGMTDKVEDARAAGALREKWTNLAHLALVPRIREMQRWLESAASERAGVNGAVKGAALGVLRRARPGAADVVGAWAELLTDGERIKRAVEDKAPGQFSDQEVAELVRWVGLQAEDVAELEDDDAEDEEEADEDKKASAKRRRARVEAEAELGRRVAPESEAIGPALDGEVAEDDPAYRHLGVDGRLLEEGSPRGKLDEHDDALLLRLMQLKLGGLVVPGGTKSVVYEHIIVDEAQDLSPTDIAVLRGALTKRESMTLAGDTAQKLIFDNGFDDWKTMLTDVGIEGVHIDQLRISYRSTREIVDFSRHVLGPLADPDAPLVPRGGAPVDQFTFGSTGEAIAFLGDGLRSLLLREKKASVAVITRFAALANMYYEGLRKSELPALRRVYGKEFTFAPGVDVVDVAQVKGLEYDYVILVEVNANTYPETKESRHLLHIAATRAVHQLWVTSTGEPSPLLPPSLL